MNEENHKRAFPRLVAFNQTANDIPRKGFVVLCVLLGVFVFMKLFRFVAPFVLALILSSLMEPLLRFLSDRSHKVRVPRGLASLLCMLVVIVLLVLLITSVSSRAFIELKSLISQLPSIISDFVRQVNSWIDNIFAWLSSRTEFVNEQMRVDAHQYVNDLGGTLRASAVPLNTLARGALVTAFSLPQILLFIVMMVLGTFYMTCDRERIISYFQRAFPIMLRKFVGQMKHGMIRAVFGQVRAQMYLTVLMFAELLIGFSIMKIPYALLLALLIAIMDALPVIGSGLFLIPWSIVGFVSGDIFVGAGMLLLYGITLVIRQLVEPRVVGAQLGVYPLATMMSMYAGFVLFGFFGMLAGPMTFLLCRVAVYAICGTPPEVENLLAKAQKRRVVIIKK